MRLGTPRRPPPRSPLELAPLRPLLARVPRWSPWAWSPNPWNRGLPSPPRSSSRPSVPWARRLQPPPPRGPPPPLSSSPSPSFVEQVRWVGFSLPDCTPSPSPRPSRSLLRGAEDSAATSTASVAVLEVHQLEATLVGRAGRGGRPPAADASRGILGRRPSPPPPPPSRRVHPRQRQEPECSSRADPSHVAFSGHCSPPGPYFAPPPQPLDGFMVDARRVGPIRVGEHVINPAPESSTADAAEGLSVF
jgi:hypothetical protein